MKNNDNNSKNSKLKEFIIWFKESWAIPHKRAGIKLFGYLIFFILFFLIAGIGSRMNASNIIESNKQSKADCCRFSDL